MNKELQETLRYILKEELGPINQRLDNMDSRFDSIDSTLDRLSKDVETIKVGQEKLQQNLIDSLGQYTEEIIRYVDDKTEVLNKRLYKVETDVARLNRQ